MTVLDWAILAFTAALAIWGYRQGMIVGVLTLLGFGTGAIAGSRAGPLLLEGGSSSPYAPLLAAIGALLIGALAAVTLEGLALGLRDRLIRHRAMHFADGAGGAALIASGALGLAWIFGAAALQAPGTAQLRGDVQGSVILGELNELLPPSGPVLNALSRVDPAPTIPGPTPRVAPPDPLIATDPDVRRAGLAVVRVLGTACGLGVEGSGWVAAPGIVVTNAHVVAGEEDTSVATLDGVFLDAVPVHYDPANDLALLRIDSSIDPLEIAPDPRSGAAGAVLGYPENGPYAAAAARLGETQTATSEDSYGHGPIRREITFLRGAVRSGNSGGPLVDSRGRVMATLFASTTSGPPGGFAIPNEIVEEALVDASEPVETGRCTR